MKYLICTIAILTIILLIGCDDNPTTTSDEIWLELKADTISGTAPLTVNFVGTLHGNIRNLEFKCGPVLCIAYRKPCIIFCSKDSTYSAVRTYKKEMIFSDSGEFWICMLLDVVPDTDINEVISSDTLLITVLE